MAVKTTIGTKATAEFVEALNYFSERSDVSTSSYIRMAIKKLATATFNGLYDEYQTRQKILASMRGAIERGEWKKWTAENTPLFPETIEDWQAEISRHEAASDALIAELAEMKEQLSALEISPDREMQAAYTSVETVLQTA